MMRAFLVGIAVVILAVSRPASAIVMTFSDGLAHTVSTSLPGTSFVFSSGTSLDLVSGAAVSAPSSSFGVNGITGSGIGSSFVSTGGAATGGDSTITGALGASGVSLSNQVNFDISGGTFTGGSGTNGGIGFSSTVGPSKPLATQRIISGGTFIGGDSTDSATGLPGQGAGLSRPFTITGGTYIAGAGGNSNAIPVALSAGLSPGEVGTVSGGVYHGALVLEPTVSLSGPIGTLEFLGTGLSFTGGHFIGPSVYEGTLTGTLSDGNSINNLLLVASTQVPSVVTTGTSIQFTAGVPEPASAVIFGSGLVGLLSLAWYRRKDDNIVTATDPGALVG